MEFNRIPDEYNLPPEEGLLNPEYPEPAPEEAPAAFEIPDPPGEYAGTEGTLPVSGAKPGSEAKRRKKQRELIRSFMAPVAATVATLSIVLASYNSDPLADNPPPEVYESPGNPVSEDTPTPTPTAVPSPTPAPTPMPELLDLPEGSVPGATTVLWTQYVVEGANGETFTSSLSETDPIDEVKAWLKTWGGNPKTLTETDRTREFLGYQVTEDAVVAGSGDSMNRLVLLRGGNAVYKVVIYYDAFLRSHSEGYYEFGDDALPRLSNLEPDFDGRYAWNGEESEEYIRIVMPGEDTYRYLQLGEIWESSFGGKLGEVPGATYDPETNVLTLENCTIDLLDVNLMGNGFTVQLSGVNHIGRIVMWGAGYAGSVRFVGPGELYVNEDSVNEIGLLINAENSASALLIDKDAELDISGSQCAVAITQTTLEKAICFVDGETYLGGGVRAGGQFVADADGNLSFERISLYEVSEQQDIGYYDYTVILPDGTPATNVEFIDQEMTD